MQKETGSMSKSQATKTYMPPGPNCDNSGHRSCPYSQWAETEIGRLRGIVRVNLLRHVPGTTHSAIDALLDGSAEGHG